MKSQIYSVNVRDGIPVVSIIGDNITMLNSEELKQAVAKLLKEGNIKILLDLSKTTFISTIVLTALIIILKWVREAGGELAICEVGQKVKEVINVTKLHKVFRMFDDRGEALAYLVDFRGMK